MNCIPGDLAVILETCDLPENVGVFVTVRRAEGFMFDPIRKKPAFVWHVTSAHHALTDSTGRKVSAGIIRDEVLQPIRPPKPGQSTKTAAPKTEVSPA